MDDELRTTQIEIAASLFAANRKPSIALAYVAWLLLGVLGLHRAYVRKAGWFAIPLLGILGAACAMMAIGDTLQVAIDGAIQSEMPKTGPAEFFLLVTAMGFWIAMAAVLVWDFFALPSYVDRVVTEYENRKRVQLAMMLQSGDVDESDIQWSLDFDSDDGR